MSLDPWVALEAQRRRRHWRNWPWGWVALVLGVLMWVALWHALLIGAARTLPGDGGSALPNAHAWLTACLAAALACGLASGITGMMGWRLRRARAAAVLAGLLLVSVPGLVATAALVA